jgi:hypothetical protein
MRSVNNPKIGWHRGKGLYMRSPGLQEEAINKGERAA